MEKNRKLAKLAILSVVFILVTNAFFLTAIRETRGEDSSNNDVENFPTQPVGFNDGTTADTLGNRELVFMSGNEIWFYNNETDRYNDSWRREYINSNVHLRSVAPVPVPSEATYVAAVGNTTSSTGFMAFQTAEYKSGSTVDAGDRDEGVPYITSTPSGTFYVNGPDGLWNPENNEYVYYNTTGTNGSVQEGSIRVTPVPQMNIYNVYSQQGYTVYPNWIVKNPVRETITLECISSTPTGGTWNVTGSVSGRQTGTVVGDAASPFTMDTGANAGKVSFYVSAANTPSVGEKITFEITEIGTYPAGSTVQVGDSDIWADSSALADPVRLMERGGTANGWWDEYYAEDVYIDMDNDGIITASDLRVTDVKFFIESENPPGGYAPFNDICYSADSGGVLAVGEYGAMTFARPTGATNETDLLPGSPSNYTLFGVSYDYVNSYWLVVGYNASSNGPFVLRIPDDFSWSAEITPHGFEGTGKSLKKIVKYSDNVPEFLIVGDGGIVWLFNDTTTQYTYLDAPFLDYNAAGWKWDGTTALLGGIKIGDASGSLYALSLEDHHFSNITNVTYDIQSIFIKEPNSPGYAVVLDSTGTAYRYNLDTVTAKGLSSGVDYPAIAYIDIRQDGGSKKNGKVDVLTPITFYIDAYYKSGWANVNITLEAWFDFGYNQSSSNPPSPPGIDDRNSYFNLSYSGGSVGAATGTWTLVFPTGSAIPGFDPEIALDSYYESFATEADGFEHHYLWVNITLGPQAMASAETGFHDNGELTKDTAFDDDWTWDVQVFAYDSNNGQGDWRYTEFGVYKYTTISVYGTPSGGGPPGTTVLLRPFTRIEYSTNCYYFLNVSMTDLSDSQGNIIPASMVSVMNPYAGGANSDIGSRTYFSGASQPLSVWGQPEKPVSSPRLGPRAMGNGPAGHRDGDSGVISDSAEYGLPLYPLENAAITGNDSAYDAGTDHAYVDQDGDLTVSPGDIRITEWGGYSSGSVVKAGDTDIGEALLSTADIKVTGHDDVWDIGAEGVYFDADNTNDVNPGDTLISPWDMPTEVVWWIDIPNVPEGNYVGTITFTIQHA